MHNNLDNFVEIQNHSDSQWSYVCTYTTSGKYSHEHDTEKGTLAKGGVVKNYHWPPNLAGIFYLSRGACSPDECKRKYNLKQPYGSRFKPVFQIIGDINYGYKLKRDIPTSNTRYILTPLKQKHVEPQPNEQQQEQWHKSALKEYSSDLCNRMDSFEVIAYLYANDCMTDDQKQYLAGDELPFDKNIRLVTWLMTQPISTFKIFCDALDKTCQAHLSQHLRDREYI